jgi:hypothetical protein
VRNVDGWGSPIGFSATNMRYVTITKSRFYNNAAGIVPNSTDTEKFPPDEDNVITDNDIFWNNFNFWAGAPFKVKKDGLAALAPVGTGLVVVGGHRNRIENNRVYGNYLAGVALIEGILNQKFVEARALVGNEVTNNAFGLNGTDTNGRDIGYDGNGSDNCISGNTGVAVTVPADASTFAACPFAGANAFSSDVQLALLQFTGQAAVNGWVKHDHPPKPGFTPLEVYKP